MLRKGGLGIHYLINSMTLPNHAFFASPICSAKLRKERRERKAAAIERSKQRQADNDYFLSKKLLNVQHEVRACTPQVGVHPPRPV